MRKSTRALAHPVTCLGAGALAVTFCLSAYLLVALTRIDAEVYSAAHQPLHFYWGVALGLCAAMLAVIGIGVWRERKLDGTTARMRQTEDAIAESRERYHLLESALNGGIWDWNLLTDDCYLSPRWKEILDYDDDDLPNVAATFFDLIHPDDKAMVTEALQAHVENGKPYNLATRLRRKNGDYRWVNGRGKVIYDDGDRPVRMLGVMVDATERKKAEAEMAESRDNLARAEQMARLGHFRCAQGSSERTWSDGLYRIFGKSRETFTPTAENILAQFHPEDRPILEQRHRELSAGRTPPSRTLRVVKDDGEIVYVEDMTDLIYDSDGALIGRFGTLQDVTARVQAEAQIAESRDNLARAEEMARLGHFKIELGTVAITWSAGTYRIFCKSPDTFAPTLDSVVELIHPDDRLAHKRYRQAILGGGEPPPLMHRAIRDDGQIIHVEVWSKPLRASDGTIIGMFGTIQDVTARKQAQALIAESRDRLARAEEMALIGHFKYEPGAKEHVWSPGAFRLFGKSPETFTPTAENVVDLFHPDDQPLVRQYRRDIMGGAELPPTMFRIIKDNGELAYIEAWSGALRASDGTVIGMFGTMQDVTARKHAEEALERANQELEARVAERTEALAQEMRRRAEMQLALAQVQKMEAVGQLSAGVAHDFNNLLAVIGGGLEFVERAAARGLPAEPELIDAALRATRRGRDLVQRLLTFARQSPLNAEPTVVDQMVLDTLRLLQRTLGEDIEIVTRLDAAGRLVSVDRNQLANALVNLALNARDAMPEGGRLTIVTHCQPAKAGSGVGAADEEVFIIVTDTGIGMTEEVRTRAFEPFFTTKRDGLGSGLGLSMVLGFVQQSGGHISIDSEESRGTTITIRLPRIETSTQPHDNGNAASLPASGQDKTVLLVEDDPDVRIVVAAQLKDLGYTVHSVANAMEAISLIESPTNIAVVLTDIVLPGDVDGVTLLKEVMRARPRIGVLCMSGYNPSQGHRKWLQVQNIDLLEKPFSGVQLAQALDSALAQ